MVIGEEASSRMCPEDRTEQTCYWIGCGLVRKRQELKIISMFLARATEDMIALYTKAGE